jgi:hypothetical protein
LEAGVDVLGDVEGARVVVHGGAHAKLAVRGDLDAGDDGLDVAAAVEEGGERGPGLLAHAVALVEDADAAGDHGADEGAGDVAQLLAVGDDGGDEQVLRAGVHGGLEHVDGEAEGLGGGGGEGGLADAWFADEAGRHGVVVVVEDHPGGEELAAQLGAADPLPVEFIGRREAQLDALDHDRVHGGGRYNKCGGGPRENSGFLRSAAFACRP